MLGMIEQELGSRANKPITHATIQQHAWIWIISIQIQTRFSWTCLDILVFDSGFHRVESLTKHSRGILWFSAGERRNTRTEARIAPMNKMIYTINSFAVIAGKVSMQKCNIDNIWQFQVHSVLNLAYCMMIATWETRVSSDPWNPCVGSDTYCTLNINKDYLNGSVNQD